ncbi:MAG: Sjogren's syndrome/scleroderma autoantigen 1 family protein [Sulfolobales archaeon]
MKKDDTVIQRMSELLRSGAVMLDLACPICSAPLFRLRSGEIVCPTHGAVRVVKTDSEAIEVQSQAVLDKLEAVATSRISNITEALHRVDSESGEEELLDQLERWLEVLERVRRLKLATTKGGKSG